MSSTTIVPQDFIESRIYLIRGQKDMLDSDLARLYGVSVSQLNQQVSRNMDRFPTDFVFRLNQTEAAILKSQFVISSGTHGGRRRARPRVFTEYGIAMLSSVLHSKRAINVNIVIIRTFIKLRRILAGNTALAKKLEELEKHYDVQFRRVFKAIRALTQEESNDSKKKIGFTAD